MNIVTQELTRRIKDQRLRDFVSHWDQLEALVIDTYRTGEAGDEDSYHRLIGWLQNHYPDWQEALRPHWQDTHIGGAPTEEDPFAKFLTVKNASDFVGDWGSMQTLPAAREALNSLLLSIIAEGK